MGGQILRAGDCPLAPGLALIFDMDGVVVNSVPVHREAWVVFNRRYGLETTDAMQRRNDGRRNDAIVRDFFGDGLAEAEVAARGAAKEELYREMIADRVEEILVPGLRAFLECHRDAPKALATNAEPENVAFLLDRAGLRGDFRIVLNGHQVSHPKPHPEIYLRAASLLGTAPANCIVFEDSHAGVQAARASGARVAGLLTTYGDLPGTDLNVHNFSSGDLRAWLAAQERTE